MHPVDESDQVESPKSTTDFFAIPKRKSDAKQVAPPPAAPPAAPVSMGPGMGMGMSVGIQGPVVSAAPVATSPPSPEMTGSRARSYRVFAILAALLFMVFSALVGAMALTVWSVHLRSEPTPVPPRVSTIVEETDTDLQDADPDADPSDEPIPDPPRPDRPPPPPPPPPEPVVTAAPITVTVVGAETFTGVEVKCPDGFRERGSFVGDKATVPDVPLLECDLVFKGGLPVRNKISGGQDKTCTIEGSQAVCH